MAKRKQDWKPQTQTQAHMLPQYRGQGPQRRMRLAVQKVLADDKAGHGTSQAQIARDYGVSPSRLSEHVRDERKKIADAEARSAAALAEKLGEEPKVEVTNERVRVPPIREFVQTYFGAIKCWDCGVHHEVPDFHWEMLDAVTDPDIKRLLVNLPPGHGKSWSLTTLSTVYEIVRDRNSMTGIVSASADLAEKLLGQIQELLTNPDIYEGAARNLIDDFGPFRQAGSTWTADEFKVGRQTIEKDMTVKAFGIGSKLYGPRLHRMILDDVADTDNQVNPEQVAKQLLKISREADSRVGKNGKLIAAGTRVQPGDLYTHMLRWDGWHRIRHPVIIDENEKRTLWPEHFGYGDATAKRTTMTPESFELIWQNSELPAAGAAFTKEHTERCKDPDRLLGHVPPNCTLVVGLDPAGAGKQAGYTAMVLLAVDRTDGRRFLVDIVNHKQMRSPQLKDQLLSWADRYQLYEIRVEANGLQSQLVQMNNDLLIPLTASGVRVTGHTTHGGKGQGGKWDQEYGIASMGPMVHNGQLSLPWGDDANTRKKVGQLESQLIQFPSKSTPDDILMALWFAEMAARDAYRSQLIAPFDARTKNWPARIRNRRRILNFGEGGVRSPTRQEQQGTSRWSPNTPPELIRLRNVNRMVEVPGGD